MHCFIKCVYSLVKFLFGHKLFILIVFFDPFLNHEKDIVEKKTPAERAARSSLILSG